MPSFSFLNASFLYYLPLLGLPVLIHLISRKKRKLIEFPSLKFLKTAYMKRVKYIKLNEMLLLIVRMLIAAFLVLAFSRFCAFMPDPTPATGLRYAIVMDDSYSLQYAAGDRKMIDKMKKEAFEFVMKFKHSPEFMLIKTSGGPIASKFLNQEKAAAEINALKVSYVPRSLANTMASLVKSERYKELAAVFVFSDFIAADPGDATKLSQLLASDQSIRQGPRVELFNIGPADAAELSKNKNLSLSGVTLPEEKIIAGKTFQINGRVKNHSIYEATAEVSLWQDESLIDQIKVKVDARSESDFTIKHSFANFGQHVMRLSLQEDAVREDNDFNFVLNPISSLYVVILYRDNEKRAETGDFKFISTALNPLNSISLKDGLIIQPVLVNMAFQAPADFSNYDAVIVSGLDALDESVSARLEKFTLEGGGVLILPPQTLDHKNFNRSFAKISPVTFSESSSPVAAPNEASFFSLSDIAYDHPVFSLFKNKASGDIEKPKFFRIIPVDEKAVTVPAA
ncbi:MAG TPA: BatA domain-containing protein, partial [Candidatus Wallbacteria bacterium]|nr:BatA domain-containing protein [Candidatus Wallbacteria bacterium]